MTRAQAWAVHDGALPSHGWERALCRRYELGLFDIALVRWRDAGGLREHAIHWAFGWLADGACEPLGVWIEATGEPGSPLRLLADLKRRGLERLRHVAGTDDGQLRERVTAAFHGAALRSSGETFAAQDIRATLSRAIRRRGSFANEVTALDFVSCALQRMERRLDRERAIAKVRPRHESGAQMVPPGF